MIERIYTGQSMCGTFLPGDLIFIKKLPISKIRIGDVIAFVKTYNEQNHDIIHRVTARLNGQLKTRGDSNRMPDSKLVTIDNYIGRAVMYERSGKKHFVQNGMPGRFRHKILVSRRAVWDIIKYLLRPVSNLLNRSGLLRTCWHPNLICARFQIGDEFVVKYIRNSQTIASFYPSRNHWVCKWPYNFRLVPGYPSDQISND